MSELRTHERPQRATRTWEPDLGWRWGEAAGALGERASGYDPRTTGGGKAPEIDTGRLKAATRAREIDELLAQLTHPARELLRLAHEPLPPQLQPHVLVEVPKALRGKGELQTWTTQKRSTFWSALGDLSRVALLLAGPDAVLQTLSACRWSGREAQDWRAGAGVHAASLRRQAEDAVAEALVTYRKVRGDRHRVRKGERDARVEARARALYGEPSLPPLTLDDLVAAEVIHVAGRA